MVNGFKDMATDVRYQALGRDQDERLTTFRGAAPRRKIY
jgi:hypothetical protein